MPDSDKTLVEWGDELDALVRDGLAAVQAGDAGAMVAVQKKLRQFIDRTPDYADALDHQANVAIINIDLDNTTQAINELKARRDDIARIIKSLSGITEEATKDAGTLRLEAARSAVDSVTATVKALKSVRDTLKSSGSDKAVADQILAAIDAIQNVRSKIEQL